MALFHASSDPVVMNEINVTPLVDVMLVLLIVFIVTAPLLMQAVKVRLPSTARVASLTQTRMVQLTINAQGALSIDRQPVALDRLEGMLRRLQGQNAAIGIRLQADGNVPYRRVAQAMAAVQRAGIGKLAFVTVPK